MPIGHVDPAHAMPLPAPLDDPSRARPWKALSEQARARYECILDDTCAVSVPKPATRDDEAALVRAFLSGLDKLFTRENNWTFLQPLLLSMEHCAHCQTCACLVPHLRGQRRRRDLPARRSGRRSSAGSTSSASRRGGMLSAWQHGDIELNWPLVARLVELAYRCNLCRRCAQTCPIGVDNGLIAHETAQGLQPGDGHRAEGAARQRARCSS
ncbi:MAG: hypothetical protein M0C28_18020 [Candidatus Moduliflexus flocculans]|nr:hypothetical protein [Candidatus Moduliflexus flocculans]